jgi:hypothetical protein
MAKPKYGISAGGRSTEERFLLLTGASKASKAALGDAVLNEHSIEVKHASSNTLNQVRPVKYITLVAFHAPSDSWYVVPAHDVVILASTKKRGQHTENPFESVTLNTGTLSRFQLAHEKELRQRVLDAINEAAKYPQLREEMLRVLHRSRQLASESLTSVCRVIEELALDH